MKYSQKDGEHYDYPEKIVVYHEKELNNSGDKCWVKSSDKISLEHLGFQHNSGLQRTVAINMPPSRCLSSAIDECIKHYAEKQQKI